MTPTQQKERWQQLLRNALADQPVPAGPHLTDDDNRIARWLEDRLDTAESEAFWQHLALCPTCRETLMLIAQLQPEASETTVRPAAASRPSRSRKPLALLVGLAACIAVAVGLYSTMYSPNALDAARASLQRDDPVRALVQLEGLLRGPDMPDRAEAVKLAEEAGYRLARTQLLTRAFDGVRTTSQRLSVWKVDSDRLANLRYQADHAIPAEVSLALKRGLPDYHYELDGFRPQKGVGPDIKDLDAYIRRVLASHPDSVSLHLNLADWLYQHGFLQDAADVYTKAKGLDPNNPMANLGLGLINYDWGEYQRAHDEFAAALKSLPDDPLLHLNMAMTLERLDRDALLSWQRARALTRDQQLQEKIDSHLRKPH